MLRREVILLLYYWYCFAQSAPTKVPMSGDFKMVLEMMDGWGGGRREGVCSVGEPMLDVAVD